MTSTLQNAISALRDLPAAVQDEVGASLLDYVARLKRLKAEIQLGLDDAGQGRARELTDDVWREIKARAIAAQGQSRP